MTSPRRYPLGRLTEHDPRSRAFPFTATAPLPERSWTWVRRVPIFDQGNLGSCTGMAAVGWVGTDPHPAAPLADEKLAVSIYSQATHLDAFPGAYPPDDTGSSGLAVAKALKRRGLITSYRHAFSFRGLLGALVRGPVIVGIPWHEAMFAPPEGGGYLTVAGDVVGGHEVLVRGVDPRRRHVLCDNSWGLGWGRNGRFWLRWDDLERLLDEDGDATVLVR